jgi:excisionase family DNA binding protein
MNSGNGKMIMAFDAAPLIEMISIILDEKFEAFKKSIKSNSRVLTRNQAAELLCVSPATISQYIKDGRLNNVGTGKKILIFESDLTKINYKKS